MTRLTRPKLCVIVMSLATVGSLGILLCTPGGIGIYSDSVVYVGVARNLLRGHGVTYFDYNGQMAPVTHYAPLYPMVVSSLGLMGIDPVEGARWLNALLFAFNIILTGSIVFASTLSLLFPVSLLADWVRLLMLGLIVGVFCRSGNKMALARCRLHQSCPLFLFCLCHIRNCGTVPT